MTPQELITALHIARRRHIDAKLALARETERSMQAIHDGGASWSAADKLSAASPAIQVLDKAVQNAYADCEELIWTLRFALAARQTPATDAAGDA